MSEPQGDDGRVDAGVEQRHRAAVPEDVGVDSFAFERCASGGRGCDVGRDAALDGIAAEPAACAGREQRVLRCAAALGDPDGKDCFGFLGQRNSPVFAAFAFDLNAAAGAERDVAAVDRDEFWRRAGQLGS
jgi:hypothetical protein